jgi:hypothetical protein
VDWNGVDEMELFPAALDRAHQVGSLQNLQMLGRGLPGHLEVLAKLAKRLAVLPAKKIKQLAAAGVGQCFEHLVCIHRLSQSGEHNMQVFTCMSSDAGKDQ